MLKFIGLVSGRFRIGSYWFILLCQWSIRKMSTNSTYFIEFLGEFNRIIKRVCIKECVSKSLAYKKCAINVNTHVSSSHNNWFCFRTKVIVCFFRLFHSIMIESGRLHLLFHGILLRKDWVTCPLLEACWQFLIY